MPCLEPMKGYYDDPTHILKGPHLFPISLPLCWRVTQSSASVLFFFFSKTETITNMDEDQYQHPFMAHQRNEEQAVTVITGLGGCV